MKTFNTRLALIFGMMCLIKVGLTQSQSQVIQVEGPFISHLVPSIPNTLPDTAQIITPNFLGKGEHEVYVNPTHNPDLVWQQTQTNNPTRATTATLLWDVQAGPNYSISPPDPSGDVDGSVYVLGTNGSGGGQYTILNKNTGAVIFGPGTMSTMGGPTGLGDPIILFDKAADRWFITEFASSGNRLIIHVSQTNNPQGAYFTYLINCPNFPDYPKYGIWPDQDAVIISTNESNTCGIYAIRRSLMLAGSPATAIRTTITGLPGWGFESITPVDIEGDIAPPAGMKPLYMRHRDTEAHGGAAGPGMDLIEIWELTINFPGSTISASNIQNLQISDFDSDLCGLTSFSCIQQPPGSPDRDLDPLREPLMFKIPYRNMGTHQTVVACLATDVTGTNQAGVRWVELRRPTGSLGAWSLYQEGTYSPDNLNRWMPSINIDINGNIMMAYSTSNGTAPNFPGLRFTGRKPCDPLGQMTVPETVIENGLSPRTLNTRWGDYHHMSIDPFDGVTFYYCGVYMITGENNRTRVASFRMDPDANDGQLNSAFSVTPPPICGTTAVVGVIVQNLGTNAISSGTVKYSVNGGPFVNQAYTPSPTNIATGNTDTVFINVTGLIAGANNLTFVNATTNGNTPDDVQCNDTTTLVLNAVATSMTVSAVVTTPVSCNNGSNGVITVSQSGGTGPFTFTLAPIGNQPTGVFSGLTPGTYTAAVTDGGGCTVPAASPVTLTNPPAITVSGSITNNVSCFNGNDGQITVTGSGGTGLLQYSIGGPYQTGTVFNSLTAGTYTVSAQDANGCIQTGNVLVISNPTQVTGTPISSTNVSCFGGSNGTASVTAGGGAGGYTYNWTPGNPPGDGTNAVTGLSATTYTCTITDAAGCTNIQTFTITQPTMLMLSSASQSNVSCNGGSNGNASVNPASGGAGSYTYNWTPGNPTGDGTVSVTGLTANTYTCTVTDANGCTASQTFNITQPSAISLTAASQSNVSCNGGSNGTASVNPATGGAGGYTYNWTPGNPPGDGTVSVTGLTANTYTCTVTDASGCTASQTFNITEPASAVIATITGTTPATCGSNNGTATVSASGGAGGYGYNWTPLGGTGTTTTGVGAGSYTATVTDVNGCTATAVAVIGSTGGLTAGIGSQTNVSCNGGSNGSATISVSGGTPSYSYTWSPNVSSTATATGLSAQTYTVTITDGGGCTAVVNVNITEPSAILANASQLSPSCTPGNNGSAQVVASGGTGILTYAWSSGGTGTTETGLAASTYTVTVTDANSCTQTATVVINASPSPTASISASSDISCFNANDGSATVLASGGAGGYTYMWNPLGSTSSSVSGLMGGTYTATVTDASGCTASTSVTINNPSPISATAVVSQDQTCNGSNDGIISASASGGTGAYQYSLNGGPNQPFPTFSGLGTGSYTVTVTDANGCTQTTTPVFISNPTPIAVAATISSNITCNGASNGQITSSAAGGSGGYNYSIDGLNFFPSNNFSGLGAGTYTVTVMDVNGCTGTSSPITLNEPTPVVAGASVTLVIPCTGSTGEITASGSGGGGFYFYSLDGINYQTNATFTGLVAGSYTVTVSDQNGCTGTTSVSLSDPTPITMSASATNITCNGDDDGTITVTASGGTGSLTYSIDGINFSAIPNFASLAPGTYQVTVMDGNGCTSTQNVNISEPPALNGNVIPTMVSCNGSADGELLFNVTGGTPPLMYSIDGGINFSGSTLFTGLAPGSYSVVTQDANGCTFTSNITITEPVALTVTGLATDEQYGNDGTITINETGGTSGYTYSIDGINYQPGNLFINLPPGTYTVYVMDDNGCIATNTVTIGSTLGIEDDPLTNGNGGLQLEYLYPNPTKGVINLGLTGIKGSIITIRVYNTLGEALYQSKFEPINGALNLTFELSSKIAAGTYFMGIYDGNEKPIITKFIRH